MNVLKKNIYNLLSLIAIGLTIYFIYNILFSVREGNDKNNKNNCFNSGKGIGCHNFYKSKLPRNGDYSIMYKKCIDKKDELECRICVQAAATLDSKYKNKRMNISDNDIVTLKDILKDPKQKCKLSKRELKILKSKSKK